jgi:threonine/homoserine/homoserine lactone efflux protein
MLLEHAPPPGEVAERPPASSWAIFRAGLLTNVMNPKVALFFLAFIPQFVAPGAGSKMSAFLFLGAVFIITSTLWCAFLAVAAARLAHHLRGGAATGVAIKRVTGAIFVGLGVKLAVSK